MLLVTHLFVLAWLLEHIFQVRVLWENTLQVIILSQFNHCCSQWDWTPWYLQYYSRHYRLDDVCCSLRVGGKGGTWTTSRRLYEEDLEYCLNYSVPYILLFLIACFFATTVVLLSSIKIKYFSHSFLHYNKTSPPPPLQTAVTFDGRGNGGIQT